MWHRNKKLVKHDAELNMFAFYVARGHKLDDLASLSATEKAFLHCAREQYYDEEFEKYKAIFGERV